MADRPVPPTRAAADCQGNCFDFTRLVLALLVIFTHSWLLARMTGIDSEPLVYWTRQASFGSLAVSSFFILSGYLITASWQRSAGLGAYLKKRVLRIYPGYIVAMLFTAVVAYPLLVGGYHWAEYPVGGLLHSLACFNQWSTPYIKHINGSTWTIQYEFLCYLLLAIAGLCGLLSRLGRWVLLAGFAVLLVYAWGLRHRWWPEPQVPRMVGFYLGWARNWIQMGPCFLAGVMAWLFRERLVYRGWVAAVCLVVLVLGTPLQSSWYVLAPTCWAYALVWFAGRPRWGLENWGRRHGDWSYGVYVYAYPVQLLVTAYWKRAWGQIDPWTLFIISSLVTLGLGWASWHLVEKRFLRHRLPLPAARTEIRAYA